MPLHMLSPPESQSAENSRPPHPSPPAPLPAAQCAKPDIAPHRDHASRSKPSSSAASTDRAAYPVSPRASPDRAPPMAHPSAESKAPLPALAPARRAAAARPRAGADSVSKTSPPPAQPAPATRLSSQS